MIRRLIRFSILHVLILSACFAISTTLFADDEVLPSFSRPSKFFALPLEIDADSGASNGDATIMRIMPLYSFPLSKQWKLGAFGGQQWSFAGDDERNDISQLMVRALVRRRLPNNWFFVSAPIITANWNAPSDQRWLVPLGGGVGKRFNIGRYTWATSVQGYYNVVKPDGAPNWAIRFAIIAALPFSDD